MLSRSWKGNERPRNPYSVGPWLPLVLSTGCMQALGRHTCEARIEGVDIVRLRGGVMPEKETEWPEGETEIFVLPKGLRPRSTTCVGSTLQINATGEALSPVNLLASASGSVVVILPEKVVPDMNEVNLNFFTFPLT